jgi:hypothetical protein
MYSPTDDTGQRFEFLLAATAQNLRKLRKADPGTEPETGLTPRNVDDWTARDQRNRPPCANLITDFFNRIGQKRPSPLPKLRDHTAAKPQDLNCTVERRLRAKMNRLQARREVAGFDQVRPSRP